MNVSRQKPFRQGKGFHSSGGTRGLRWTEVDSYRRFSAILRSSQHIQHRERFNQRRRPCQGATPRRAMTIALTPSLIGLRLCYNLIILMAKHRLSFGKITLKTLLLTAVVTFLVAYFCVPVVETVYGGIAGQTTRYTLTVFNPALFTEEGLRHSYGNEGKCCDLITGSRTELILNSYIVELIVTPIIVAVFFFAIFSLVDLNSASKTAPKTASNSTPETTTPTPEEPSKTA